MRSSITPALLLVSALTFSSAIAAPPVQESVAPVLGPKAYSDGDVIEITDVTATSPRLEQGDSLTVTGRYHLKSRKKVQLSLYLTQTEGDGLCKTDPAQVLLISRGEGEFTLKKTIRHRGALHLTMYDARTGKPIGGTYFGTAKQMQAIADWDVSYYLSSDDKTETNSRSKTDQVSTFERLRRQMEMYKRFYSEQNNSAKDKD